MWVHFSRRLPNARGTLDVLRKGINGWGCHFDLAYFQPESGLNEEHQRLYNGNILSVIRQLHYSEKDPDKSIDTVLFLNGLPIFTAELKNPLKGQTVDNAITQYRKDRDPKEPLLRFGRCLAHFAVDSVIAVPITGRRCLNFSRLGFEIPEKLAKAPPAVVAEVWN
jgi:type I restriction enzyme R subunit